MAHGYPSTLDRYYDAIARTGRNPGNFRFFVDYMFEGVDLTGKTMLDVGAGDGRFSFYAAAAGAREVVSLEPDAAGSSGGQTGAFQKLASLFDHPNVRLVPETLQQYEHEGELFDLLLLTASINHLDEAACIRLHEDVRAQDAYLKIFGKLAALAKPGARLIAADCGRRNLFGDLNVRNPIARTIEWDKHQAPELWAQLLMRSGFARPQIRWNSFNTLRSPGRKLLGNRAAAYCLRSSFCLTMERDTGSD